MDFELPGDDDPTRRRVRRWLEEHPNPTGGDLARAGYVAPHWPAPYGVDANPIQQLVIDDELRRAGVRRPSNPIGIGWAGPTLLHAGTTAQQERYLPPMLSGEEIWCQLFSEPGAGSDLAALGTRAELDGDQWIVNGQKVWTSLAHLARFGILLARTDPEAEQHRGISYFVCPMDIPGIEVRPIVDMTGVHAFNEVFLSDVRLPAGCLVGEEGRGWELARVTLANERVSLSTGGVLWGNGPTGYELLASVTAGGPVGDRRVRQRLSAMWTEAKVLDLIRLRTLTARVEGRPPGPEASVRKLLADLHGQHVMELALDLKGAIAMSGVDEWSYGFLFSPALTIGGGTAEVQRNIIGERVLGLPRDRSSS